MSRMGIVGFTGYSGRHIAAEALRRGHEVIGMSRQPPPDAPGVDARAGSIEDRPVLEGLFADAHTVVIAMHASADGRPILAEALPAVLSLAAAHGRRVGFVGGSGSLLTAPGGPRLLDSPDFSFKNRVDSLAASDLLDALRAADTGADWFYVSPAYRYGAHAPGEDVGRYRLGGDVLVRGEDGVSRISGPDFARAVLDEVETPRHHRTRFTVGQ